MLLFCSQLVREGSELIAFVRGAKQELDRAATLRPFFDAASHTPLELDGPIVCHGDADLNMFFDREGVFEGKVRATSAEGGRMGGVDGAIGSRDRGHEVRRDPGVSSASVGKALTSSTDQDELEAMALFRNQLEDRSIAIACISEECVEVKIGFSVAHVQVERAHGARAGKILDGLGAAQPSGRPFFEARQEVCSISPLEVNWL